MSRFAPRVIADDYGLGAGHDAVIRELLELGAITGTSVLVEHCDAARAEALLGAVGPGQEIGLHLNLTLAPAGATARPTSKALLLAGVRRGRALAAEAFPAQLERFRKLFGRPPDYIDGHEHAHTFPGVRDETVRLAATLAPAWTRSTVPGNLAEALRDGGGKVLVIAALGRALRARLRARGLATNDTFSGFLNLADPACARRALPRLLAENAAGNVLMVHPGRADDPMQCAGHAGATRAVEAEILAAAGRS